MTVLPVQVLLYVQEAGEKILSSEPGVVVDVDVRGRFIYGFLRDFAHTQFLSSYTNSQ